MEFALILLPFLAIFMIIDSLLLTGDLTGSYMFDALCLLLLTSLMSFCVRRKISVSPVMHVGILHIILGMVMAKVTQFNDKATLAM